tara:strand:- start:6152 stop:6913 length:762 start_codon:yes stop_codon:yes gene_type:complete
MCGIAGIIGHARSEEITSILQSLEIRGHHATGVAFNAPASKIVKAGIDAATFVRDETFRNAIDECVENSTVCLLHTRHATHGSPEHNDNNHPIFSDKGIIIHNGIVNVETVYDDAKGDTDTEQLLLAMDQYGIEDGIKKASGSFSIAYQRFNAPHLVWLYNHVSPLEIAIRDGKIYFCSTRQILFSALGSNDWEFYNTKRETVYQVDAHTMEVYDKGEVKPVLYHYPQRYGNGIYATQRFWNDNFEAEQEGWL